MSMASAGKILVAVSDPESDCPSRTVLPAFSSVRRNSAVPSESAAVSRPCTSGMPPVSSVLSTLANCATWYFSQISPRMGVRILTASIFSRADSFRAQNVNRNMPPTSAPKNTST